MASLHEDTRTNKCTCVCGDQIGRYHLCQIQPQLQANKLSQTQCMHTSRLCKCVKNDRERENEERGPSL